MLFCASDSQLPVGVTVPATSAPKGTSTQVVRPIGPHTTALGMLSYCSHI